MIDPKAVELHDALLKSTTIDYVAKTLTIGIEFYQDAFKDPKRKSAFIVFDGVTSFSQTSNFDHLQMNAAAGNVTYWKPDLEGVTYIYLSEGCISIEAEKMRFEFIP